MKSLNSIIRRIENQISNRPLNKEEERLCSMLLPKDREIYAQYLRGTISLGEVILQSQWLPDHYLHHKSVKVDIWFYLRVQKLAWDAMLEKSGPAEKGLPYGWHKEKACWDSMGHYGFSQELVEAMAYSAGCKVGSAKFNWLAKAKLKEYLDPNMGPKYGENYAIMPDNYDGVRIDPRDLKRVPIRLLGAYFKGVRRGYSGMKRVDILVLGRVSAASAAILLQGYEETRQLNWEAYREFRDASNERRVDMLPANLAWNELGINPYDLGIDTSLMEDTDLGSLWDVHPSHVCLETGELRYTEPFYFDGNVYNALRIVKQWFHHKDYFDGTTYAVKLLSQFSSEQEFLDYLEDENIVLVKERYSQYSPEGRACIYEHEGEAWEFVQDLGEYSLYTPFKNDEECKLSTSGAYILGEVKVRKTVRLEDVTEDMDHHAYTYPRKDTELKRAVVSCWVPFVIDTVNGIEVSGDDMWEKLHAEVDRKLKLDAKNEDYNAIFNGEKAVTYSFSDCKRAGFCIRGTKIFLNSKAPFLGRLIQPYNSWSEVPQDLLDLQQTVQFDWSGYGNYLNRL